MAMDAYVQLALIEKTKRVFAANAEIFLSFPLLSPLTFKPAALVALSTTPASMADYAAAGEFARIVNFPASDIVASGYGDRYLWDVYADILERGEFANGAAGDAGQGGIGGSALLYEVAPDGTRTESAIYRSYRQYRDAWILARENYGERKLSGELTDNADAVRHWNEVEEPALRAILSKAEEDWKTLGHRDEVDAALQAERDAALKNPQARWKQWKDAFNRDLDLVTEGSGAHFGPTGLSPRDFTSDTAWLSFNLSAEEMVKLVSDAPAALKVVLDGAAGTTIDRVSFDYRSVAVVRPWFDSSVLTSRIWRSSDPELVLSDGGDPPSGACPGYVTAVVFVRNLRIFYRTAPTKPATLSDLRFTLPANRLVRRDLQIRPVLPQVQPSQPATVTVAAQRAFSRVDKQSLTMAPTLAMRAPVQNLAFRRVAAEAQVQPAIRNIVRTAPLRPGIGVRLPQPTDVSPPTRPVPTPTPPPPERHDELTILAFICKRLPKVPDPMPGLRWV